MKFNEVEIKVVDFVSDAAFALLDGGGTGSGEEL